MDRNYVKCLQTALAANMFNVGAVDGLYGPRTERAIRKTLEIWYGSIGYTISLFAADGQLHPPYLSAVKKGAGTGEAPWLYWAEHYIGTKEFPGAKHNKNILQWFKDINSSWFKDDETPWCAAFVGAMLERAGWPSTDNARARSYSEPGAPVDRLPPGSVPAGAIVVLSRGRNPKHGHVGFVTGQTRDAVEILGGNQGDAVSKAWFPKSRVVGLYWPTGCQLPEDRLPIRKADIRPKETRTS